MSVPASIEPEEERAAGAAAAAGAPGALIFVARARIFRGAKSDLLHRELSAALRRQQLRFTMPEPACGAPSDER